jgi:hypothetical protein
MRPRSPTKRLKLPRRSPAGADGNFAQSPAFRATALICGSIRRFREPAVDVAGDVEDAEEWFGFGSFLGHQIKFIEYPNS